VSFNAHIFSKLTSELCSPHLIQGGIGHSPIYGYGHYTTASYTAHFQRNFQNRTSVKRFQPQEKPVVLK